MIIINKKDNCCGCGACEQICPHQCIKLTPDKEGFSYPEVDKKKCIECHLCEKVCPIINVRDHAIPENTPTYAVYNPVEQQRLTSSSGGMFQMLASYTLMNGGIVCGAQFDKNYQVEHVCISEINEIEKLKRSKYVQSSTNSVYKQIHHHLINGKNVLFVGTPCQVSGLKCYLRKEYENLITVDVVCHGVPSPDVWRKYLEEKKNEFAKRKNIKDTSLIKIDRISFRDKVESWRKFHLSIDFSVNQEAQFNNSKNLPSETYSKYVWEDEYMLCFLQNFSLRPSCYNCHFRKGKCKSDLTLADFWRINEITKDEELIGEKGTSVVHLNTKKGNDLFNNISCYKKEFTFSKSFNYSSLWNWPQPPARFLFFLLIKRNSLSQTLSIVNKANKCLIIPYRVMRKLRKIWQK